MDAEIKNLRIDRSKKQRHDEGSSWAKRFIIAGITLFVLAGAGRYLYGLMNYAPEVEVYRVKSASSANAGGSSKSVILNATGYIVAHHKIQVASKVVGRVLWIGVEKGDRVKEGQVIVRLEDDEYKAQLQQSQGQLHTLQARLEELTNGSRPEEIATAKANVDQARADLENAEVTLRRTAHLVKEKVMSQQTLDDADARVNSQRARVNSLEKTLDLVRLGARREVIDAVRGQIVEARGRVAFYQTQLNNTIIKAPVTGTVLERNVEKGEFVTTGFVGDKGAKGYVVSLANLNDLQVELDINQNDFARLDRQQKGIITTDAYPDRKYQGIIDEIAPEANRQKATVQVKVKVLEPDDYLRPDMNASVAFVSDEKKDTGAPVAAAKAVVFIPSAAIRSDAVFIVLNGKVVKRPVRVTGNSSEGMRVEEGLIGGEDLVLNPGTELKDGDKVKLKGASK
ncbi:efflux RND transporter periplasmic adaptor subunit [Bryobacter aggregatus]|uniref:efflux RND transporter periplasmic adaptor subunit n=1 Tax=Bryobacter aggregatus TaxID=360054 RepID=UPI0004E27CF8|nr:efflux RND transporter periplasmic adaptor subunit [Bryobacter aggregatus]